MLILILHMEISCALLLFDIIWLALQRMPGDVGIWDLAVSINNQRLISEDDSGNKQKEASLIFIGENLQKPGTFSLAIHVIVTQAARVWERRHWSTGSWRERRHPDRHWHLSTHLEGWPSCHDTSYSSKGS